MIGIGKLGKITPEMPKIVVVAANDRSRPSATAARIGSLIQLSTNRSSLSTSYMSETTSRCTGSEISESLEGAKAARASAARSDISILKEEATEAGF